MGKSKAKNKCFNQKLKTMLADPYKGFCPTLKHDEMHNLRLILLNIIKESKLAPKLYASQHNIHLGLKSCLRSIKNCQTSCVLLSLSLKPGHLISLIAKNVQVKNPRVTTFVQPNLEAFTREVFNVSTIAMSLPMDAKSLVCEALHNWIQDKHMKYLPKLEIVEEPKKLQNEARNEINHANMKRKHPVDNNIDPAPKQVCRKQNHEKINAIKVTKPNLQDETANDSLEMDYISFNGPAKDQQQTSTNEDLSDNKQQLSEAFIDILQRIEKHTEKKIGLEKANSKDKTQNYRSTIVLKVCSNPARAEKSAQKKPGLINKFLSKSCNNAAIKGRKRKFSDDGDS